LPELDFERGVYGEDSLLPADFLGVASGKILFADQIQTRPASPAAAIHFPSGDQVTDQTGFSEFSSRIRRLALG
jgi:hypothetical protein